MAYIYGLYDAQGNLRYIGKANDMNARLSSHMRDSLRRNTPLYSWIRKNGAPEMRLLAETSDWKVEEARLIADAVAKGEKLLNLAKGGDEPFCPANVRAENGRKNAAAIHGNADRKRLWSLKQKLAALLKQGYVSASTLKKMQARPDVFGVILSRG